MKEEALFYSMKSMLEILEKRREEFAAFLTDCNGNPFVIQHMVTTVLKNQTHITDKLAVLIVLSKVSIGTYENKWYALPPDFLQCLLWKDTIWNSYKKKRPIKIRYFLNLHAHSWIQIYPIQK